MGSGFSGWCGEGARVLAALGNFWQGNLGQGNGELEFYFCVSILWSSLGEDMLPSGNVLECV